LEVKIQLQEHRIRVQEDGGARRLVRFGSLSGQIPSASRLTFMRWKTWGWEGGREGRGEGGRGLGGERGASWKPQTSNILRQEPSHPFALLPPLSHVLFLGSLCPPSLSPSLPPSLPPRLLAGLVDVGNVHVRQCGAEFGGIQLVVGSLGCQDLVLLIDLVRVGREGEREGRRGMEGRGAYEELHQKRGR